MQRPRQIAGLRFLALAVLFVLAVPVRAEFEGYAFSADSNWTAPGSVAVADHELVATRGTFTI